MRWKWRPCFWSQRMVNGHKISVFNGPSQFFQHSYSIYQPFSSFQFIVRIHQHLLIPTMFNSIYLRFFAVSWRALASDSRVWPISRWGSFWGLSFVHTQLVSRRSGALLTDQRRNQKEESDADSLCTFPLSLPPSPFIFLFVSALLVCLYPPLHSYYAVVTCSFSFSSPVIGIGPLCSTWGAIPVSLTLYSFVCITSYFRLLGDNKQVSEEVHGFKQIELTWHGRIDVVFFFTIALFQQKQQHFLPPSS